MENIIINGELDGKLNPLTKEDIITNFNNDIVLLDEISKNISNISEKEAMIRYAVYSRLKFWNKENVNIIPYYEKLIEDTQNVRDKKRYIEYLKFITETDIVIKELFMNANEDDNDIVEEEIKKVNFA